MNNSTDAPASVTYSIERNGFQILFTVRGDNGITLLDTMETVEKKIISLGYKAQEKRGFAPKTPFVPQPSASGNKCPKCGAPMALSKLGREYCSKLCWKNPQNPLPIKVQEEDGGPLPF